jgi:thiol:disulfide interchange protein DsbD
MDVLKQVLAFPMYGAAVWLVWVVSQEAGPDGVLTALAGMLALAFAGWAWGRSQAAGGHWLGLASALAGIAAAAALLPEIVATPAAMAEAGVESFSADRLAELRRDGRPVFVNMTAAWCVSCLVNEKIALSPQPVQDAFRKNGVAYLRGDWTRQDPAISSFLHDHGREGVPLYIYYAPGKPPSVLPQILTEQAVLNEVTAGGA